MAQTFINLLLEATIKTLKERGKSEDISVLLLEISTDESSLINDFLIELSLVANPNEEVGVGCYSIEHIEKAYNDFKKTGTTELLNTLK
jgi:hypothetical protein